MRRVFLLLKRIFLRQFDNDNQQTWIDLEMQYKRNLENLEYLKKLRIKNF